MVKEICLIVLDWEGTMTESGGGRVPWPTRDIYVFSRLVDYMRNQENLPGIILCTGRQQPSVEAALQAIHAFYDIPSICENGSILYYPRTKEFIFHPLITEEKTELFYKARTLVHREVLKLGGNRELGKEYCISVNPRKIWK